MGKPFFIFIILFLLLFLLTPFAALAQDEEEAANGQLQPAPPPHLRPKHDKSGRTGRPLYKQVAPFPAVGEGGLNGSPPGGEPVQDDNELLSVDRFSDQQPPLVMPPLPSISDSSVTTTSRTNLSAGHRCDGVQRFCAEGLICETFSPSYHLGGSGGGGSGGSSGPNVSSTASNHQRKRRSIGSYHPVEGICSQRTCESKCDLGLAASASSMKCPADSYLVQWVWHDGSGGGEGDDGSKPCCIQTCKCIPDICSSSRRNCSFLYERARLGTEEPGNCCDTIQCPEDIEPEVERSKHPHQQQVAKSPAMSAPKTSCRVEEGEGEENGSNGGEEERQHGERWFTGRPHCEACHCQSGVRVCSRLLNCPLPFNCTDSEAEIAALPDDQCCPPCKSCVNPLRPSYDLEQSYSYRHGESWFSKDHCTECRCTDGQASCYSETCQASAVACARDQSWAPVEGATGGTGGGVSCCHPCTCHLDCGKGVPYMRSPTTGLEVCDCNLTAAVGDLQLLANEIGGGGDKETMNHLLQSTASPGELVSLSGGDGGDAAASVVNTSPSSVDPCLEGGGGSGDDASCKRSESDIDTANWTQIGVAFALVVLILGGFFVARCYFCSPSGERCWKGKTSTRSGGTSARFSKQSTGEPQEQQQFLSAPVDDSSLPEKHGLTIPMHTMTSTKAGS